MLVKHALGPGAVRVVNQMVALILGGRDAPLGSGVVVHVVVVAVQMVGRDVQQHPHIWTER